MNTLTKGIAAALAMTLAACSGGGGDSGPTTPAAVAVTCPNGTQQTAATADAANAACPAPKLVSVAPVDGATAVSPDSFTSVTVVTDSTLDAASLTSANVTLKVGSTNSIAGTVAATDGKGFKWTPTARLAYGQKYDFAANVKDNLGRPLAVRGSFTTALISCTAPLAPDSTGTACVAAKATGLSLIAGTADNPGSKDGPGLAASFTGSWGIDTDEQGNAYLADGCENTWRPFALYRKIASDGTVSKMAGSKMYGVEVINNYPLTIPECVSGLLAHSDGNLYASIGNMGVIKKITPLGSISTIAGAPRPRFDKGATDGIGSNARFNAPLGITADPQGNLYVADSGNHTIRKIDATGNVTTFAGAAGIKGNADDTLLNARFSRPELVKYDRVGNRLLVSDDNGIRAITNDVVSTLFRMTGCLPSGQPMSGLAIARDGRIAITYVNFRCVQIYRGNNLEVELGSPYSVGDSDGSPSATQFFAPSGLAFLPNGDLLISDIGNHNIKRYSTATNTVNLYAGQRFNANRVDGTGSSAKIYNPRCLVRASSGDIWFSQGGRDVRKVDLSGTVKSFTLPDQFDGAGCILKVNKDGSFVTGDTVKNELREWSPTGALQRTLATQVGFAFAPYSAVSATGDIYFLNANNGISKYANGSVSEVAANIGYMGGITITKSGDLIVAAQAPGSFGTLFKVSPTGSVSTFASTGTEGKWIDGAVGDVALGIYAGPDASGLTTGAGDDIYVVSNIDNVIRRIRNGRVDIIVGTQWVNEVELGAGPGSLHNPREIVYDPTSNSLVILTDEAVLRAQLPD